MKTVVLQPNQVPRIIVVLGNPPYNGFAGVAVDEEARLIKPYKAGLADWGITKNYLDDLYVRFFHLAEPGKLGVVFYHAVSQQPVEADRQGH